MSPKTKFLTDDKTYCNSVAKSISDIIRFSLDEEFRKNCFKLFEVSGTQETESEIEKRLMHLIQNENTDFTDIQSGEVTVQNESKNDSKRKDEEENIDSAWAGQNNKEIILSPRRCTDKNNHPVPQNIFKRNWLQISSQQYREIIKRKKSNYYSQPEFDHGQQNDFDFFSCGNSQTSFSCPSLPIEGNISLPVPSGGTMNCCKNKFRNSFKDNFQKYFKNLSSHRF